MDKEEYDMMEENRKTNESSYSYPKHLKLIRGIKEWCLYQLIKPEDLLELRIVPEKRE